MDRSKCWARANHRHGERCFICAPKDAAAEEPCARKILSALATRAYRRPLTESEVQVLLDFYKAGRSEDTFDAGIQRGIERILAAPNFLFRSSA